MLRLTQMRAAILEMKSAMFLIEQIRSDQESKVETREATWQVGPAWQSPETRTTTMHQGLLIAAQRASCAKICPISPTSRVRICDPVYEGIYGSNEKECFEE